MNFLINYLSKIEYDYIFFKDEISNTKNNEKTNYKILQQLEKHKNILQTQILISIFELLNNLFNENKNQELIKKMDKKYKNDFESKISSFWILKNFKENFLLKELYEKMISFDLNNEEKINKIIKVDVLYWEMLKILDSIRIDTLFLIFELENFFDNLNSKNRINQDYNTEVEYNLFKINLYKEIIDSEFESKNWYNHPWNLSSYFFNLNLNETFSKQNISFYISLCKYFLH